MKTLSTLLAFFLSLSVSNASVFDGFEIGNSLGISPFKTWKTLESENFRVTYVENQKEIAQKSIQYFEEAHRLMSGIMKWTPVTKTQIVIVDSTDLANGLTSAALRFGIVLYPTPPESWFSTAFYDDWLRLLVIHEYTHFLNMDPVKDFYKVLRFVFGDVIRPNTLWPTWMLEGLAVYMETRFTQKGRGRSSHYEMILRTAVKEKALNSPNYITLDKLTGPNPYPPEGETPYLFGYQLMNQLASSTQGDAALGELSSRSSERIPFFLNSTLEVSTGKNWFQVWDDWVKNTNDRIQKDINAIEKKPVSQSQRLTPAFTDALAAKLSPDGKTLVYTAETIDETTSLFTLDMTLPAEQRKPVRHFSKVVGTGIAFLNNTQIIFSQANRSGGYTQYSDLFIYDLASKDFHCLTSQSRYKDPDYHPESKRLVFTYTDNATTGLMTAVLEENDGKFSLKNVEKVFWPQLFDRAANPSWSKDGKKVAFSFHKTGNASEEIYLYDTGTKNASAVVNNGAFNRFPSFTRSGNLIYSSDLSGVDNVYEYEPSNRSSSPLTNMVTGAWFPTESNDSKKLIASVYRIDGFGVEEITKSDVDKAPQISAPVAPAAVPASDIAVAATESSYSIIPSIWPRQWAPYVFLSETTKYFGAQTLGFDALDLHRYFLLGTYETFTETTDFYAAYENRLLGATLGVAYTNETSSIEAVGTTLLDYIRKEKVEVFVYHPFKFRHSTLQPRIAFETNKESLYAPAFASGVLASTPQYGGISAQLSYSYAESSRLALQTERGFRIVGGAKRYFLSPGAKNWKFFGNTKTYIRLADHAILTPSLSGAYVSKRITGFQSSNVVIDGGGNAVVRAPIGSSNIDELKLRGYPDTTFVSKYAYVGGADLQFPLARIFRGWKTYPLFLENLSATGFAESAYFPLASTENAYLPAAGGGLKLGLDIFYHVPVDVSVEYHHGFKSTFGGKGEVIFLTTLGSLGF